MHSGSGSAGSTGADRKVSPVASVSTNSVLLVGAVISLGIPFYFSII